MSNATDKQIEALMTEANNAGDYAQAALCAIALDETHLIDDAEPGTDFADAMSAYMAGEVTVDSARAECSDVISHAASMDDSDDGGWDY